jgi:carboxylesterase
MIQGDSAEAGLMGTPSQAVREMWRLVAHVKRGLGTTMQPALIIHARDDDVAALSNAIHLQKHLGGMVDMVVLDDSYHLVTLDRQAGIVISRSLDFMGRLAPSAAALSAGATPGSRMAAE